MLNGVLDIGMQESSVGDATVCLSDRKGWKHTTSRVVTPKSLLGS